MTQIIYQILQDKVISKILDDFLFYVCKLCMIMCMGAAPETTLLNKILDMIIYAKNG